MARNRFVKMRVLQFGLCLIVLAGTINIAMLKPVQNLQAIAPNELWKSEEKNAEGLRQNRLERQVVQPTWLTKLNGQQRRVDAQVHVNQQNLQETANIRKTIQDAVQRDQFAVPEPNSQASNDAAPPSTARPMPPTVSPWYFPQIQNNPAIWAPQLRPVPTPSQEQFMAEMQRMWLEFVENSRRMFSWT